MGICWLILQEARWAPTNLALGNFLRREKMGEQICYGATHSTVHGRSCNWCKFQGYGDFSQTHDALPRLLEVQTRPDRRATGQLAPGRWP